MKLSIAKDMEDYIKEEVERGGFEDASELVNDALRLHEAYQSDLRAKVQEGLDDLKHGRVRYQTAEDFMKRALARR